MPYFERELFMQSGLPRVIFFAANIADASVLTECLLSRSFVFKPGAKVSQVDESQRSDINAVILTDGLIQAMRANPGIVISVDSETRFRLGQKTGLEDFGGWLPSEGKYKKFDLTAAVSKFPLFPYDSVLEMLACAVAAGALTPENAKKEAFSSPAEWLLLANGIEEWPNRINDRHATALGEITDTTIEDFEYSEYADIIRRWFENA